MSTSTKIRRPAPRAVSHRHDPAERQADKAADIVARGGSVSGWSFAAVASSAPLHRDEATDRGGGGNEEEKKKPPEDENKGAPEAAKAALDSPAGTKVQRSILDLPEVKNAIEFAKTPQGIGLGVGLGAVGLTALAVNHRPLPLQPPAIPLDKIGLPGLSAKVTLTGPVDRPTGAGLTLSYRDPGPSKKRPSESERTRAETARLRADQDKFRAELRHVPGSKAAQQQEADDKATQEAVARFVASRSGLPGVGRPLIPVTGSGTTVAPAPKQPVDPDKKPDDAPVQREPAQTAEAGEHVDTSRVDGAVRGGGRPLEPSLRRSMEARFGYDFSHVRLHDDAAATAAAHDLSASAFTLGSDIVLGRGLDARTPAGRHLLAHELAHVVQQSGARGPVLQRRSVFESIGIWLGVTEGTWSNRELRDYLDKITSTRHIDGAYDADNKARAIVARWKSGTVGYDLRAPQKALLIAEMLDGPTLDDDENAILDLLELSDASDLRAMFTNGAFTLADLESDLNFAEHDRLDSFLNSRFDGGRSAVAVGRIVAVGPPVPQGAPTFLFDAATVDGWVDSHRSSAEVIAIIEHLPAATRTLALHHLSQLRRPIMLRTLQNYERRVRDATTAADRLANIAFADSARSVMLKVERVLLHFFHTAIPATAADLLAGTSPTDPARQNELSDALTPPTASGPGATFRNQIPGETKTYEAKLRDLLPGIVSSMHTRGVVQRPPRTHTLSEFEAIAVVSKDETDAVFDRFYNKSAHQHFVADQPGRRGTLHDAFADTDRAQRRMNPTQRRNSARDMLTYLITTRPSVAELNRHHDARPSFDQAGRPLNDEARFQDRVARAFVTDAVNVRKLLEIDRGWDASANPRTGDVFVQLYQPTEATRDRLLLWDMFQTLIHEYLHTVVAPEYRTYAESFGRHSPAENTLMEGMDSVLDEVVWEHVEPRVRTRQLREKVEGVATAALPPIDVPHPAQRRYPSYTEALKLIDLVGIANVYAAYFLGRVDRIGGPAPGASP